MQLLQRHVPPGPELLASSLYMFRKNSVVYDSGNVEHIYHYYCPICNFPIPDQQCAVCPNSLCDVELFDNSIQTFSTLSIGDQVKILLNREYIFYFCFLLCMYNYHYALYRS